jgi:hypothetical protein
VALYRAYFKGREIRRKDTAPTWTDSEVIGGYKGKNALTRPVVAW